MLIHHHCIPTAVVCPTCGRCPTCGSGYVSPWFPVRPVQPIWVANPAPMLHRLTANQTIVKLSGRAA